ncbi:MAG: hypothetical protein AAGG07_00890 [Planctomycetota bacterium]
MMRYTTATIGTLALSTSALAGASFGTNLVENGSFEQFNADSMGPVDLENGGPVDLVAWVEESQLDLDLYSGQFTFRNPPGAGANTLSSAAAR